MPCRWCLLLNLGKSGASSQDFQVYAAKVRVGLTDLLHGHETERVPSYVGESAGKKTAYIVITSGSYLVGGYNALHP